MALWRCINFVLLLLLYLRFLRPKRLRKRLRNVRHTGAVEFTVSTVGLRLFAML